MAQFYRSDWLLVFSVILQLCLWRTTHHLTPELTVVPPVSSELTVKAASFGDEQFYFRTLALEMQNTGDMYGTVTALKDYNYKRLGQWFFLLDSLDSTSNFVPAIASYYYGQTQHPADLIYIVDYLDAHASRTLSTKWWWMAQAVYIANHRMKNKERALELANKLAQTPGNDIPLWVRQMPAFIHAELGEKEEALMIINHILKNEKHISEEEHNFMSYFINERLDRIIHEAKTPGK